MAKKVFRVQGNFRVAHHTQPFNKEVVADTPDAAKEYIFSILGSKHGVPRRLVKIGQVSEVAPDQVENPVVRFSAGLKA